MKRIFIIIFAAILCSCEQTQTVIPLPEHPRPDFQRENFINLNGQWAFTFNDSLARTLVESGSFDAFDKQITVPFPWGSALSSVENEADVAWYARKITVPSEWKGRRVFLVIGASDYQTCAYVGGKCIGVHEGGYTPFEFEITDKIAAGRSGNIFLRVDDKYEPWHLYGKQGYGNARGIWQTVYLETRGENFLRSLHFSPDIDNSHVEVEATLDMPASDNTSLEILFKNGERPPFKASFTSGKNTLKFDIPISNQHLWELDDPYLYEITASLSVNGNTQDKVDSYFGQRKISTIKVRDYTYVALNNRPIYLQLCLDQSYHPDGFYTFPSDEFMRNEIQISKNLGLNGNRIHIKTEIPRKLYWADKLGLLIMADIPNYWGEPTADAKKEWERTMREQIIRDFNHPSIFAWVDFNETWGLFSTDAQTGAREYSIDTQEWVRRMYKATKQLDPTRLVEDNSACNYDHVQTDINSWHGYHTNYVWEEVIDKFDKNTYPGSSFNFTEGNVAGDEPMINSECGNVWGYQGSAGDCDYTWDYHEMMNAFHRHPKVGGWLYTEHHDVINEWNGYVRFDRSEKFDGLDAFVPGMTLRDLHSPYYIVPGKPLCYKVKAGEYAYFPIYSCFMSPIEPEQMTLEVSCTGFNGEDKSYEYGSKTFKVPFVTFKLNKICEVKSRAALWNDLIVVKMVLRDKDDEVISRNFSFIKIEGAPEGSYATETLRVSFPPDSFKASSWSIKEAKVLEGLKVNGFGKGFFEYEIDIPEDVPVDRAKLVFEASAKQLFAKDMDDGTKIEGDFMLGGGTLAPCKNPNSYAMTDTTRWASQVVVSVNGTEIGNAALEDDPADHRGVLSWISQPKDRTMCEAGSYGYLLSFNIPANVLSPGKKATIRISVPSSGEDFGGIAIYGKDFGRYPIDPTILFY